MRVLPSFDGDCACRARNGIKFKMSASSSSGGSPPLFLLLGYWKRARRELSMAASTFLCIAHMPTSDFATRNSSVYPLNRRSCRANLFSIDAALVLLDTRNHGVVPRAVIQFRLQLFPRRRKNKLIFA
jgi:DTW domain-containing protein YfiP